MTRTFDHQFQPAHLNPVSGGAVSLTVAEIESAGIREVLQTTGARVGSWSILDGLLEPGEKAFLFREPLGAAREVKVAASGLFGRFVARAYLERYMKMTFFAHLGSKVVRLGGHSIEIRRKRGCAGDLPDWVACSGHLGDLTIAEAKGSHDKDPSKRLSRAYAQAGRVDVLQSRKPMRVKRIAIVTRWASKVGGHKTPIIAVKDPVEPGHPDTESHLNDAGLGIARVHMANLLDALGIEGLAANIRELLVHQTRDFKRKSPGDDPRVREATEELSRIKVRVMEPTDGQSSAPPELVGSYITRAGPLGEHEMSLSAARSLRSFGLRPMFVGVERRVLQAIVEGEVDKLRNMDIKSPNVDPDVLRDSTGTWLIDVGERFIVR